MDTRAKISSLSFFSQNCPDASLSGTAGAFSSAVTFHFNHCRYAGDNTFDFPFCIYIQYLSDGCEVSCDIIPNSVKLPYNPDVLAEEGKEYMDTACNELLKLLEEKMNDKSPEN